MLKKLLLVGLVLVIVVIGGGVVLLMNAGGIAKHGIEKTMSFVLKTDVTVGSVDISWSDGSADIFDMKIASPEGYNSEEAFSFKQARVQIVPSSIQTDTIHIKEIILMDPSITLEQKLSGSNLKQLQKNASRFSSGEKADTQTEETAPEEEGDGKKVIIDLVKVEGTRMQVHSNLLDEPKGVTIAPFEMTDFGRGNNAITVGQATAKFLTEVLKRTVTASADVLPDDVTEKLGEGLDVLDSTVKEGTKGVVGGIKNLLGGDKE